MAEAYWYVAHTYSGYENKVKANLEKMIKNRNLEEQIFEVRVPVQEVVEIRKSEDEGTEKVEYTESGERKPPKKKKAPVQKVVKKKLFPGYVFVHMIMNEDNWYLVRNTRGVTGFVGSEPTRPVPLTEEEMMNLGVQAPQVQGFDAYMQDGPYTVFFERYGFPCSPFLHRKMPSAQTAWTSTSE